MSGRYCVHKAEFLDGLAHNHPGTTKMHFRKRLVSYTDSSDVESGKAVVLNFKDGPIATCDLLIGSHDIHSVIRNFLLEGAAQDAEAKNGQMLANELRDKIDPFINGES